MADVVITVTIPDALVTRVGSALGVSTKAEFQDWVRTRVKQEVLQYEMNVANATEQAKVDTARQALITAVDEAQTKAETEITLT